MNELARRAEIFRRQILSTQDLHRPTEKTMYGEYIYDKSGLSHYHFLELGPVQVAAEDALAHRPEGAAWFWFENTPTPIEAKDDIVQLTDRWNEWRQEIKRRPETLLVLLQMLSERVPSKEIHKIK
jgi:hypothetical protein